MIDISGTSDQRHHHIPVPHSGFYKTSCPARPIPGNKRSPRRIRMIADRSKQQIVSRFVFQIQQRNFRIDFTFWTHNIRIEFPGVRLNRSIFHPESAVETTFCIGGTAALERNTFTEILHSIFQRINCFFCYKIQILRTKTASASPYFRCSMTMRCCYQQNTFCKSGILQTFLNHLK